MTHPAFRDDAPVGLVLSGGGARGAFQVGVWEVLRKHGVGRDPDVVSGTSAGALNGALIAAGLTPEQMLEFWIGLAEDPPVVANADFFASLRSAIVNIVLKEPIRPIWRRGRELRIAASLFGKHRILSSSGRLAMALEFLLTARFDIVSEILDGIHTSYLFDTSRVREHLRRAIGGTEIRGSRVRLAINTVDVRTGGVVRIVNHRPIKRSASAAAHYRYHEAITLDMILASAAIPLLFNAVQVGEELLWDGGLLVNTPIAPAVALGARRIIPVLVTSGGAGTAPGLPNFGAAIERLADAFLENAYSTDRKLLLDRNALAKGITSDDLRVVDLFVPVRPASSRTFNAGSYLYFEKSALLAMHEAGRKAAHEWLARGPLLDERD